MKIDLDPFWVDFIGSLIALAICTCVIVAVAAITWKVVTTILMLAWSLIAG